MDHAAVAGAEFQRPHVTRTRHRHRHHERAEDVGAVSGHGVRLGHADDEIGRTELPAVAPVRRRRKIRGVAFNRAGRDPLLNRLQLGLGKAALVQEFAAARRGLPRRHDAPAGDRRDLRRSPSHIAVRQQAEGAHLTGPVARRAAAPDDRRDVFVEREARLRAGDRGRE
jgi:hypothetical protein